MRLLKGSHKFLDGARDRDRDLKLINRDLIRPRRVLEPIAEQIQLFATELALQYVKEMHQRILRQDTFASTCKCHRAFVLL
jgi:hypothetical protein